MPRPHTTKKEIILFLHDRTRYPTKVFLINGSNSFERKIKCHPVGDLVAILDMFF